MGDAQIVLSNSLVFAIAAILIIYIIYLLIKRTVEKRDGDSDVEAKGNRAVTLRKIIFTFLYSAMTAGLFYLVVSRTITAALIYFAAFFIIGLLKPERTPKPKSSKTKMVYIAFGLLLIVLTVIWTASIHIKIGAWVILFIIFLIERIEKKYFIPDHTSSQSL